MDVKTPWIASLKHIRFVSRGSWWNSHLRSAFALRTLIWPPFTSVLDKIRPRPYHISHGIHRLPWQPILNRERLPRRKRESNGKRKRASSVSCSGVSYGHKQSHKLIFQSLDQLQPRNETSRVLRWRCWKQTRASHVQMNIIINNNFIWISSLALFAVIFVFCTSAAFIFPWITELYLYQWLLSSQVSFIL